MASDGFRRALRARDARPAVSGTEVDWPQAVEAARSLLETAYLPLFHGLIGDLTCLSNVGANSVHLFAHAMDVFQFFGSNQALSDHGST